MHEISSDTLSVKISDAGAELQSIFLKEAGIEYMWNADPAFWAKKSPVLFPIVGGLKNNSYTHLGKTYHLPRHGFAREKIFTPKNHTVNSIRFDLASSDETLKVYPFHFLFSIIYTVSGNGLSVQYLVHNTDETTMYFSVGAHPAFAIPLVKGNSYTDYYLSFSKKEDLVKWPLSPEGLINKEPVMVLESAESLPLTKELFYGDALVFKQLQSDTLSIRNHQNKHGISVSFPGFPYMGIWSAKNAGFVCIEPWCGIADSVDTTGELISKEGINALLPGETFDRSWQITVY
jgi:galactose mutarotase-like enzyme